MAFIDWVPKFAVGSQVLDQQHKGLITLINQLHTAMLRGGVKEDIQPIFQDLITYTQSHFTAEEEILQQCHYPQFGPHQREHVEFVEKIGELHSQVLAGKLMVSIDLLRFLKNWLSEHILDADQQYKPFLKGGKAHLVGRA